MLEFVTPYLNFPAITDVINDIINETSTLTDDVIDDNIDDITWWRILALKINTILNSGVTRLQLTIVNISKGR